MGLQKNQYQASLVTSVGVDKVPPPEAEAEESTVEFSREDTGQSKPTTTNNSNNDSDVEQIGGERRSSLQQLQHEMEEEGVVISDESCIEWSEAE
jgi:hypothetical protein